MAGIGKRAKKGRPKGEGAGEATVKEASDVSLLSRALEKLVAVEKTEEEKAAYAARMTRLAEALKRHRQKQKRGPQGSQ